MREVLALFLRLDYLSCVLTICSTILVGRRCWQGWVLAAVNSIIICVIGFQTARMGFIPANLVCIGLYIHNLRSWHNARPAPRGRVEVHAPDTSRCVPC